MISKKFQKFLKIAKISKNFFKKTPKTLKIILKISPSSLLNSKSRWLHVGVRIAIKLGIKIQQCYSPYKKTQLFSKANWRTKLTFYWLTRRWNYRKTYATKKYFKNCNMRYIQYILQPNILILQLHYNIIIKSTIKLFSNLRHWHTL